jgi:hypothetical protein
MDKNQFNFNTNVLLKCLQEAQEVVKQQKVLLVEGKRYEYTTYFQDVEKMLFSIQASLIDFKKNKPFILTCNDY